MTDTTPNQGIPEPEGDSDIIQTITRSARTI